MKISESVLDEVKAALEEYKRIVYATNMTPTSKRTYTRYPEQFVRWLDDDFEPGSRVR